MPLDAGPHRESAVSGIRFNSSREPCLHHRYPKTARLRRAADFRRVVREGLVCPGAEAVVRKRANEAQTARLGIAAPRRYGNAVRRNRFRRLVREAFREVAAELGPYDYMVSPKRSLTEPTLEGLREDLLRAGRRSPNRSPRQADSGA